MFLTVLKFSIVLFMLGCMLFCLIREEHDNIDEDNKDKDNKK